MGVRGAGAVPLAGRRLSDHAATSRPRCRPASDHLARRVVRTTVAKLDGNHRTILRVEGSAQVLRGGGTDGRHSDQQSTPRTDAHSIFLDVGALWDPAAARFGWDHPAFRNVCATRPRRGSSRPNSSGGQSSSGGTWRPVNEQCLGDVVLRVVRDGEVLFQSRETVLPETTRFSFAARTGAPSRDVCGSMALVVSSCTSATMRVSRPRYTTRDQTSRFALRIRTSDHRTWTCG